MNDDITAFLELPKTRLRVIGTELQRLNKNGNVAMRLPVRAIASVNLRYRYDYASLVFLVAAFGLGAIALFVSENNLVTTLLYVFAVMLGGFSLLAAKSALIVISSATGVTNIQCADDLDEGEGFVDSIRGLLESRPEAT